MSSALKDLHDDRPFLDLEPVATTRDVRTDEGALVGAGTHGTVVGIWGAGRAYEVEFVSPAGTVTLPPEGLRRLVSM